MAMDTRLYVDSPTPAEALQPEFDKMIRKFRNDLIKKDGKLRYTTSKTLIAKNHKYNKEFQDFYNLFFEKLCRAFKIVVDQRGKAYVLFDVAKSYDDNLNAIEEMFSRMVPAIR